MASQEFYCMLEVILDPEAIDPEVLRQAGMRNEDRQSAED